MIDEHSGDPGVAQPSSQVETAFAQALQHHQAGRLPEAEWLYRQVLSAWPEHADSLHLLGVALHQTGRVDLAAELIGRAIALQPDAAAYHCNLGNARKAQGRLHDAIGCYRTAAALQPDFAEAHFNLANVLKEQGRLDEAVAGFQAALSARPGYLEALNNLGDARRLQGKLDDAARCLETALRLKPDYSKALSNLGQTYREQGRLAAAEECYRRMISLQPGDAEAHTNLGNVVRELGRLEEAAGLHRSAIALRPDYAEAHSNLANTRRQQGVQDTASHDQAIACYREAIRLKPDLADAHYNLATLLLARGDMQQGWQEYEWRWKTRQKLQNRGDFDRPLWLGQPAPGQTLLLHAEQGFGDTLQFCRFAPLAAARGLKVIMRVPRTLVRLLRSLSGVDLVLADDEPLPPFDLHCPMMSLPMALGTTLATIPAAGAYLRPDVIQAAMWQARLGDVAAPRVGLVWAGSATQKVDGKRSIDPWCLAPLVNVPGLRFISLQKGGPASPASFGLVDFMHQVQDFADTAALVTNLDLVIAVDTAIVHLAGALGKPVWLLDRFDPCWRWLSGRRDSPWYPLLQLYRQTRPDDWDTVVQAVSGDLRQFARAAG